MAIENNLRKEVMTVLAGVYAVPNKTIRESFYDDLLVELQLCIIEEATRK